MAEVKLGWARTTIRLGQREKKCGIQCIPASNMRGRKPIEFFLPNLSKDIREIVDEFSQTDPKFRNKRLYTRLTVKELRNQLITYKGYSSESLPGDETLRLRMNRLGMPHLLLLQIIMATYQKINQLQCVFGATISGSSLRLCFEESRKV